MYIPERGTVDITFLPPVAEKPLISWKSVRWLGGIQAHRDPGSYALTIFPCVISFIRNQWDPLHPPVMSGEPLRGLINQTVKFYDNLALFHRAPVWWCKTQFIFCRSLPYQILDQSLYGLCKSYHHQRICGALVSPAQMARWQFCFEYDTQSWPKHIDRQAGFNQTGSFIDPRTSCSWTRWGNFNNFGSNTPPGSTR